MMQYAPTHCSTLLIKILVRSAWRERDIDLIIIDKAILNDFIKLVIFQRDYVSACKYNAIHFRQYGLSGVYLVKDISTYT